MIFKYVVGDMVLNNCFLYMLSAEGSGFRDNREKLLAPLHPGPYRLMGNANSSLTDTWMNTEVRVVVATIFRDYLGNENLYTRISNERCSVNQTLRLSKLGLSCILAWLITKVGDLYSP